MTDKAATEKKLLEFFCRHLVGLAVSYWTDASHASSTPDLKVYSGTLIEIRGIVYYLTAGHILKDLRSALLNPGVRDVKACLIDTFGPSPIDEHPIPFVLAPEEMMFIDDDDLGLDFGLLPLSSYYLDLLAKNNVVALGEEQWVHQHGLDFDAYSLLGFPAELNDEKLNANGYARMTTTITPVERIVMRETPATPSTFERFCGRIGHDLDSPKGMSGGPIIGFVSEPPMRYWVVAIQSSWDRSTRTIYGCPLPTLAAIVTALADRAAKGDIHTP